MRKFTARLLCAAMLAGLLGGCAQAAAMEGERLAAYENGQIFVLYTDGTSQVLCPEGRGALAAALDALAQDETVALYQPNHSYTGTALSLSDALIGQQWALDNDGTFTMEEQRNPFPVFDAPFTAPSAPGQWTQPSGSVRAHSAAASAQQTTAQAGADINVEQAWAAYDGGSRDVVIALIDTGVDDTHEDLSGCFWVNEGEIPGNDIDDDGNGYIDDVNGWNFYAGNNDLYAGSEDDHGTHGAGTIAAQADNGVGIAGIVQSGRVKIMVLKALGGANGEGSTASVIQAIQYAQDNGADICNLSLGSSQNDRALYQTIASSSMLFVAAAGNDGKNADRSPCYPASYDLDNIIAVANLNYDGTLHSSSNYGAASVDLAAPGSHILSTTSNGGYSYMTGTSMAAPMVTAAAAMVYSHYADISLADVKTILLSTVQATDALAGLTVSGGMLDLGAAMTCDLSLLLQEDGTPAASSGSAPEITAQLLSQNGRQYLLLTVTDPDGDLTVTAYASGALTAEPFQGGSTGQTFSLRADSTALFSVSGSGTFTFYAVDRAGNETVQTLTITVSTPQPPGMDRMPGRSGPSRHR